MTSEKNRGVPLRVAASIERPGARPDGSLLRATEDGRGPMIPHNDGLADTRRLSGDVRAHLGKRLRDTYRTLVHEPIPDRLIQLLEQLEASEKNP